MIGCRYLMWYVQSHTICNGNNPKVSGPCWLLYIDLGLCAEFQQQGCWHSTNHCSGNFITGNTASSNGEEGITADNQSNGGQVCTHQMLCFSTNHLTNATLMCPLSPKLISFCS